MTEDPETGEVSFEHGGAQYRLVFDIAAIRYFERESAKISMIDAFGELEAAQKEGKSPNVSLLADLMHAALRRHHPEVSPERALRMASAETVQQALGLAGQAAAPSVESAEGNVPRPKAGAKRPTSTRSGKARSKRTPA